MIIGDVQRTGGGGLAGRTLQAVMGMMNVGALVLVLAAIAGLAVLLVVGLFRVR